MKAVYVRNLDSFKGDARLFKVAPPAKYTDNEETEFLVVSKVQSWASETYIFPGNEAGEVIDWGEMPGSMKGNHSHKDVLSAAGYEVE